MTPLHRDVNPILIRLRAFLLGREHTTCLRYEDNQSSRSPPPPDLRRKKVYSNFDYYKRDPSSFVKPPIDLQKQKLLTSCKAAGKLPAPGKVYLWD